MEWVEYLQWPAMAVTVASAWMTGSQKEGKRMLGFWGYLLSNALWILWGWNDHAWALVGLQLFLAAINIRGAMKNKEAEESR